MGAAARRVLIVDGDADSRAVYRILLEHHDFEVHEVDDGAAAFELVQRLGVDVVVTELTLRLVDGHSLLERLQDDERTRGTCVIVLTARALNEDRERALRAGCTRFLAKPVEPTELLQVIVDVIDTHADLRR